MTPVAPALQVTCTVDSREAADALARAAVDGGLAACAQVVGPIASTYRWAGEVETATEWLLLIKTTAGAFPRLRDALVERHPYDVPEVVAVPIAGGHPAYLDWIADSVR
jgi:periplasmic divalent cation tolerance protein